MDDLAAGADEGISYRSLGTSSAVGAGPTRNPYSTPTHQLYELVRVTEQQTTGCVSWASKEERRAQGLWTPIIFQSPFQIDMCDGYLVRTPRSCTARPKLVEKSKQDKYNRRPEWSVGEVR